MSAAVRYLNTAVKRMMLRGEEPAWVTRHPRVGYVRQGYLSVPLWLCTPELRAEMRWIHWCKCAWSVAMSSEHVLDHIVPLNGPGVSGLTVPWNLRLVPRRVNDAKGARCSANQLELSL